MKNNLSILLFLLPVFAFGQNISIANVSVPEGNSGQKTVEVIVIVSPAANGPIDVDYASKMGKGTLHFNKGETMKKITIPVNGDVTCESNEKIDITLSNATAGTILNGTGTVTVVDDDCNSAPGPAKYEIRLTATGYLTFSAGPPDCPVRTNGKVVLYGIVYGKENVPADDDINYRGTLQLDMDMDICSIKRDNNGEDHHCVMTLNGSGPVEVDLEIKFDARGGYIKIENKTGGFVRSIKGGCEQAEMDEELTMIPNRTIASVFNGLELLSLTNRTLTVGTYRDGSGGDLQIVTEVIRKIK